MGKVSFSPSTRPVTELTRDELAEKLRPVQLIQGNVYRLETADYEIVDKILSMADRAPSVPPHVEGGESKQGSLVNLEDDTASPQRVINSPGYGDQRIRISDTNSKWWFRAHGWVNDGCSATLIGRSTALSAAHCFYIWGGWWPTNGVAFGASNQYPSGISPVYPVWPYHPVGPTVILPTAWVENSNPNDIDAEVWDFAVLEFSLGYYPGGHAGGWYGVRSPTAGTFNRVWLTGYPSEKYPHPQMWESVQQAYGGYYPGSGVEKHYIDMTPGQSGAALYDSDGYCIGINVAESVNYDVNYYRRWTAVTGAFFDAYGNWP